MAINFYGSNVNVENIVVVSSTTITCDFVISAVDPLSVNNIGQRNVTVSHTGGTSGIQTFTVGFPSDFLVFFG